MYARASQALLNLHSGHEICISCRTTIYHRLMRARALSAVLRCYVSCFLLISVARNVTTRLVSQDTRALVRLL